MGTSNFHNVNARCIYPVLLNYEINKEDEDGNETDEKVLMYCDDFDYECLVENVCEMLKEKNIGFVSSIGRDIDELRSYPSKVLGTVRKEKTIGGIDVAVELVCVLRSAYYEGANLDYCIYEEVENEDLIDIVDQFDFYSEFKGISKIHAEIASKWIETTKSELIEAIEDVYSVVSGVKLRKVATFSNGETIYETC